MHTWHEFFFSAMIKFSHLKATNADVHVGIMGLLHISPWTNADTQSERLNQRSEYSMKKVISRVEMSLHAKKPNDMKDTRS